MEKFIRLKPNQFGWCKKVFATWIISILVLIGMYVVIRDNIYLYMFAVLFFVGIVVRALFLHRFKDLMDKSKIIEDFVGNYDICTYETTVYQDTWGEHEIKRLKYYPTMYYKEVNEDNCYIIKIRMGEAKADKFKDLEWQLANRLQTICVQRIEERGYLSLVFEINKQEQIVIKSCADIPQRGDSEIVFSNDIVWDWKKSEHLLLIGDTGTGKTTLIQYIVECMIMQGIRVLYCDPKSDNNMRMFCEDKCVRYVTDFDEIAKVVREIEEEVRMRENCLSVYGIDDEELASSVFPTSVFLFIDDMIALSLIMEKRLWEETRRRICSIVTTGRSKKIYCGLILQRPDTTYVDGATRDNCKCRIALGNMTDVAYGMIFGKHYSDIINLRSEIGSGLIYRDGMDTRPREFIAPYICEGALDAG